jgi:Zn-finger protein
VEPKDSTANDAFKGFTNSECPFYPCHQGVKRAFNCLFCYCPLNAYDCPGPFKAFTSKNGVRRKDCSACTLPHDGHTQSWAFIQKWLAQPVPWDGGEQTRPWPRESDEPTE